MKTHELKLLKEPFREKWDGNKSWEYRLNDRDYQLGDILLEKEYDHINNTFTGREITEQVTYIVPGGQYNVPDDYVIMSTKTITTKGHTDEDILKFYGWTNVCISPFEIEHDDGSFASGQAARITLSSLKEDYYNGLERDN